MNNDLFQNAVNNLPKNVRCIQTKSGEWNLPIGHCFFGVPKDKFFGWTPLKKLPKFVSGFNFYLGSDCLELLIAFSKSDYIDELEVLRIGNSSFNYGRVDNYSELVKTLEKKNFPNLKVFELGIWELFCNAHCSYGKLGDITKLLKNMPNLEYLRLGGNFELSSPIEIDKLTELTVNLDDDVTGINGGYITNETLSNLLNSNFPELKKAWIDLECENNDYGYSLPDVFLSGEKIPKLKKLEITGGFKRGEKSKLKLNKISLAINPRSLDDIIEIN